MAGKNYGSVYIELFGTSSPVSGSAPTDLTDGQPIDGLTAITPVVSSASGTTLSGAGTLQCYLLDPGLTPQIKASGASSTSTTIVLNESGLTAGFEVGMTVQGTQSAATGVITSIGGSGNKTLTCSGGVTGTVVANEIIVSIPQGRWVRFPSGDSGTVPSGGRDAAFAALALLAPRKGRIKWVPNGVTFSAGSAGVTVTQLGQIATGLHNAGNWGG